MPVTRSSSHQDFQRPSSQPYNPRRAGPSGSGGTKKTSKTPSNEIIVLSSDDDEPPPKGTLSSKKTSSSRSLRKKTTASPAPLVPSGDVLEISSDDDNQPKKRSSQKQARSLAKMTKNLECTIKKLQEDLDQSKRQLASASREVEQLKRDHCKDVLSGLEEFTSCEVCTITMWCPYILPECGHSFCEACLTDWFSTIHAQHLMANPQLDDNRAALSGQLHALIQMIPNLHAYGPHGQTHLRAILAELRRHRPEYTCPSCRKVVLNTPVEDYRFKGLIREVAEMMGETDPRKDRAPSQRAPGPFDHFFAAPISAG